MTIGDRIKQKRGEAKLNQTELAKAVGVSREAVSQWESGTSKGLKPENLLSCSKALACSIEWLITGQNNDHSSLHEPPANYNFTKLDLKITAWAFDTMDHAYESLLGKDASEVTNEERADLFADLYAYAARDPQTMKLKPDTALSLVKFEE